MLSVMISSIYLVHQVFVDLIKARAKKLDMLVQNPQESLRVLEEDSGDEMNGMRANGEREAIF